MSVANLSVRRPVLMTVMALVIILLGAFGASNLGVREYPSNSRRAWIWRLPRMKSATA